MHDARPPHLLHALSRIGRAAGLAPVALAPLMTACEVDDASLGPVQIPADAVEDDVERTDRVPASGQAVQASEGRVRTLPTLEPTTASASASTQAVRPFLRLEGLVAPGHVARFRAGGIPPESTVHLMAGTHDETMVGGAAVYVQQVHPLDGGPIPAAGPHDEALSAWGVRPVLESHLLGLRILEQVVRPAAEAMFAELPVVEA